jgi:NAD-dependent dihydropyrimidine dehydrogenase PreA subunit
MGSDGPGGAPRPSLRVDPGRCLGCGQCLSSCPLGLIEIRDNLARLVQGASCVGKGACLGHCSANALFLA